MNYRDTVEALSSDALRRLVRTAELAQRNVIHSVLDKRDNAHAHATAAAQLVLGVVGGDDAASMHARAVAAAMRQHDAGQHEDAEKSMGVADALWDYLRERSDT